MTAERPTTTIPGLLERAELGDRVASYALIDYPPLAPIAGKLRPVSLLRCFWDHVGTTAAMEPLQAAVRAEFGLHGTAWGIKRAGDRLESELYWYVHGDNRPVTITRVAEALRSGGLDVVAPPDDGRAWYSLSVDVPEPQGDGLATATGFHAYLTHHPATPRTALSYRMGADGLRLENVYYLFDPADALDDLRTYLAAAPPTTDVVDQVLWDEMLPCDHVAYAHKPGGDGLYYGGIDVDQLIWFLGRVELAGWLLDFVVDHRDDLDYLRFDVGVDYRKVDGRIEVVKSGVYGPL